MISRKLFLPAVVAVAVGCSSAPVADAAPFQLEKLPYGYDALEPYIGEKTLRTHHLKHHNKYVVTANSLIEKDAELKKNMEDLTLERIITTHGENVGLFNNAAQIWNHAFYWRCMKPGGGGEPGGSLMKAIKKDFGSFAKFKEEMTTAALTAFGSGWAWLGYDAKEKKLVVTKTTGAGNPMTDGIVPILTIDVWEHAYYLDYQQDRPGYVKDFFEKLVNWEHAELGFDAAMAAAAGSEEL